MSSFSQIYNSLLVQILTGQLSTIFFTEAAVAGDNTYPYAQSTCGHVF